MPRRRSLHVSLLAVLLPALALPACRSPRPASIASWRACVVDSAALVIGPAGPDIGPGATPVLYLHARWGESPFVTEYSFGNLMAELRGGLTPAATTTFTSGSPLGAAREGGQILTFDSTTLAGAARVVRSDAKEAVIDLDLHAISPTVDLQRRGALPFRGTITARRVSASRDCHL